MRLLVEGGDRVRVDGPVGGFEIEAAEGHGLGPFHLLAASLAACTHSVLYGWAHHASLDTEGLALGVDWTHEEDGRVREMMLTIHWPTLPQKRRDAALRAAATCSIHRSLESAFPVHTKLAG